MTARSIADGRLPHLLPGLMMAAIVATLADAMGTRLPLLGAPVAAILLGVALGSVHPLFRAQRLQPGLAFTSKALLQTSIVVLGAGLSIQQIGVVGVRSLPVMVATVAAALGGAWVLGPRLGLGRDTTVLIGVGTAICGASAIAATTAVIRPRQSEIAYALGTIFTFNIVAVLTFPALGHLLSMSPQAFGLWAGTAVNDTSSVVAAAYSFDPASGPYAVVVKLVRTLMIIPICFALAWWRGRADASGERVTLRRIVPPFVVLFVLAALVNSAGLVPAGWHTGLSRLANFLIAAALAAIGMTMRVAQMRAAGYRPLVLGAALWVLVAGSSLVAQALTGTM